MQYGNLSPTEILKLKECQNYTVRNPTYAVWIEGLQISAKHIMAIHTQSSVMNIGKAILTANNKEGSFYKDGKSNIRRNAKIRIWAGFDNLNIPIFTFG